MIELYILLYFIIILNFAYLDALQIPDKVIIIGDSNVLYMVKNFYTEVILKYKVPNFSMVVWNPSSYDEYKKHQIPVENSPMHVDDSLGCENQYSSCFKKVNMRMDIVLYYLKQNLSVLHMDCDLWFFKDPLELLRDANAYDEDITYSCDDPVDCKRLNFGLFYVKSSKKSIELFEQAVELSRISDNISKIYDQEFLNVLILNDRIKDLKHKVIENKKFVIGWNYFIFSNRFSDELNNIICYGFHNNGIQGHTGKIYRLKELGLWKIDDDEYYSSKSRKYIKYAYEINTSFYSIIENVMIYLLHLGKELNRTIIFPRFFNEKDAYNIRRSFTDYFNLYHFEKTFGFNYRENISFL